MFQFLIGTLKTIAMTKKWPDAVTFQFLIGTLKTGLRILRERRGYRVSIPHRYAKNLGWGVNNDYRGIVSIPHRYAKNLNKYLVPQYQQKGFNSS